ncbi:bifunctional hydroxymethylpyrimidine kinase/phosphomethylpyrimidine kinase [Microbacterium abyssi]|uniref:bifunctional hydroxymethylpyrimidine kinase/phosphomethylpyrimidine kinase n=1 Tax=Microbacterium abyssi TaxID=2782166 RepID=UPI0018881C60|nr:bifunctional hydroxymethylpyrimidine kinase/phosphomethylpyrimidine kinase [Microbacterium sp. A18JL241]
MTADLSVYLVTDAALCGDRGVAAVVREAVAGGVSFVQLRDKTASDAEIVEQLIELSEITAGRAALVVNDRLDAAIEARRRGARVDGVHLGQGDASVLRARELLGPDALIGLTANTHAHLEAVRALPPGTVDHLGVGVIRPTSTKSDHPPALGIEGFRAIAAASPVPCVAIGGVGIDDAAPLRDAGAAGVAVVSALCAAEDPREAARALRRRWFGTRGVPRVLSIAGSDPSGGAGIQADLKAIAANGGYGMAVVTALTAQNTRGVRAVHVPPVQFLAEQLDAISDDIAVDAVKIGMLANADVIRTVKDWLERERPETVVIDPVMISTSGDRLLDSAAESALFELLHSADIVTPNLAELAVLGGTDPITEWEHAKEVAAALATRLDATVLVKGGHLGGAESPDALVTAHSTEEFTGGRIATDATHGTGCSLSSALTTRRATGEDWRDALRAARAWLRESLRAADDLGVGHGNGPVHHFAGLWSRGGLTTHPTPEELRAQWWTRIGEVRSDIDALPFIRALSDGTLERTVFLDYLAQDALYLGEYARVLAEAARLAPTREEQVFWARGANGAIAGEMELHSSWLVTRSGAGYVEPNAVTTAYLDHLRAAGYRGDYDELIAAVLPCYWLYADLGARLRRGDLGAYARDPEHPYASWLRTYGDDVFAQTAEEAIGHVIARACAVTEQTRARMFHAFEVAAGHERAFFAAPL